jgi:hypothetical protein
VLEFKRGFAPLSKKISPSPFLERGIQGVRLILTRILTLKLTLSQYLQPAGTI